MRALAFLNLGASEIVLILVVLLVLFGADKAPQLARSLGRARAQLDQARGQISDALRTDDERAWDAQLAFEAERERKVREGLALGEGAHAGGAEGDEAERARLVRAAEELGLQTQGLSTDELKAALRARLGGAGAGGEGSGEQGRDARQ